MSLAPPLQQRLSLAGVPALVVSAGAPEVAAQRGTVLLLHGLTGFKEQLLLPASALAHRGYLAIAIDAVGHGERRYAGFAQRFGQRGEQSFFEAVERTAAELPALIDELTARGWLRPGGLGGCGFSMGGFILFGAVTAGCPLAAMVTVNSSPRWRRTETSPHQQLDRFFPVALSMHTASDDTIVPPRPARELHAALLPYYAAAPERLGYLEHAGEGHMTPPERWPARWAEVERWFERFLAPSAAE